MLTPAQITDDARPRLVRGVRLQIDHTSGKAVLLYPEGVLELNETAQQILIYCDGRTVGEIVGALAEQYDIDVATPAADVREILADLHQRKLIELA
jgi:pyrroloquinoline quinone biosynthesis protein D